MIDDCSPIITRKRGLMESPQETSAQRELEATVQRAASSSEEIFSIASSCFTKGTTAA